MPFAKIEVRRSHSAAQVQALVETVYQARREAFQVPEGDRPIRYVEHHTGLRPPRAAGLERSTDS